MTQLAVQDIAMGNSAVQQKVLLIIAQELELDTAEITPTGHFVDDYDADSLSLITVVARIEKEVGIVIPKTELADMVDLQTVFALLAEYQDREPASA